MKKRIFNRQGFSIIELLVAATILSVTIVAVVSMVRKSQEIQLAEKHHQEVRAILNAQFEQLYGYKQFASIAVKDTVKSVVIDNRNGSPLTGTLYVSIDSNGEMASGTLVPVKKVSLSVAWDEAENERDSLILTKWVAE